MQTQATIDEMDLTVRSTYCLKRAGITTFGELCALLDESADLMRVRYMGLKSTAEVLRKAKEMGYPSDEAVARHIEELKRTPEINPNRIQFWEGLHESLKSAQE